MTDGVGAAAQDGWGDTANAETSALDGMGAMAGVV